MQIRNNITLIGNVGQQPELRKTSTGNDMISFSLATNEYWSDKDGKRQTRTEWHKIIAFGRQAQALGKMLEKGERLAISGALRYNRWMDKNNQPRITAQIHINDFVMLSNKRASEPAQAFA